MPSGHSGLFFATTGEFQNITAAHPENAVSEFPEAATCLPAACGV
jgi:hypothetical protein